MESVTLQGVIDWIAKNRTTENYAFSAFFIASQMRADPAQVEVTCQRAVDADALASVEVRLNDLGEQDNKIVLYTSLSDNLEGKIPSRSIKALIGAGKLRQVVVGSHVQHEWVSRKSHRENLTSVDG